MVSRRVKLVSWMGASLRFLGRKVSLWSRSSRSTGMLESLMRVTSFSAGLPYTGMLPKSISAFSTRTWGRMTLALTGSSIVFEPRKRICMVLSRFMVLMEWSLKVSSIIYSALMLPVLLGTSRMF